MSDPTSSSYKNNPHVFKKEEIKNNLFVLVLSRTCMSDFFYDFF